MSACTLLVTLILVHRKISLLKQVIKIIALLSVLSFEPILSRTILSTLSYLL